MTLSDYDWDWKSAESEYRRGIALNPDSGTAHHWFGTYLKDLLRFDEALREIQTAVRCDPLSMMIRTNVGGTYFAMGEYDKALKQFQQVLELNPGWLLGHTMSRITLTEKGMYEEALAEFKLGRGLKDDAAAPVDAVAYMYAVSGRIPEARELIRQIEQSPQWNGQSPFEFASINAALEHLASTGYPVRPEDVVRLSPLVFDHINLLGRYAFSVPDSVARGQLRPLRNPADALEDVA